MTPRDAPRAEELLIHLRCALATLEPADSAADAVRQALADAGLAAAALGGLLADSARDGRSAPACRRCARRTAALPAADRSAAPAPGLCLPPSRSATGWRQAAAPLAMDRIGQRRGRLTVIGFGARAAPSWGEPAARRALDEAEDISATRPTSIWPDPSARTGAAWQRQPRGEWQRLGSLRTGATGRAVVLVSSGDPGVFAMAAAVLEALHGAGEPGLGRGRARGSSLVSRRPWPPRPGRGRPGP
ncbi:hypothetical protein P4114_20055 [Pseudomonas aeruginosa]|nr:hypothetical protein [Pseudomonas aeruginosa]